MKHLREFVCGYIWREKDLYDEFASWLDKQELDTNFVLIDDNEDLEVLKLINKWLEEKYK
jgi:hypothetical protein